MALIIQPHQSQEGIQVAGGARPGQHRSTGEFLTPGQAALPQGMRTLAAGLDRLNQAVFREGMRQREELVELDLIRDMQEFQTASQKFADEYRQQYQGRDAANAEADSTAFHKERLDALRSRWAGNRRALLVIERHGGGIAGAGVNALRDYGMRQTEVYKDSTFAADRELFLQVLSNPNSTPEEMGAAYAGFTPRYERYLTGKGLDERAARIHTGKVMRQGVDARTENAFRAALESGDLGRARKELERMEGGDAADFAAQFESGGQGSFAVGYDAKGGTSYGKFQLSSEAGTMDAFIAALEKGGAKEAALALREAGPTNTGSADGKMPEVWRSLVEQGLITEEAQDAFIRESHVEPALKGLSPEAREAVARDPALSRALFSTAVQHGPGAAARMWKRAWKESGRDAENFLDRLYEERKGAFPSSTPEVRQAVANRLDRERGLAGAASGLPSATVEKYRKLLETREYSATCRGMEPEEAVNWAVQHIEDPEVQASVIAEQQKRAGLEAWQERQDLKRRLEEAYDGIREAETPREAQDIIDAFPPEEQAKLDVVARRRFSGELTLTDKARMGEFLSRLARGETDINLKADYGAYFSDMDMARAEETLANAEKKNRVINASQLFDSYATEAGLKSTEERREARALFNDRIERENANTVEKQRDILFDMFRTVEWDVPFWFDRTMPAYQARSRAAEKGLSPEATERRIRELPDEDIEIRAEPRRIIVENLKKQGVEPTEAAIRKVFLANRERMGWI